MHRQCKQCNTARQPTQLFTAITSRAGNDAYADAEAMSQRYMRRVLLALHGANWEDLNGSSSGSVRGGSGGGRIILSNSNRESSGGSISGSSGKSETSVFEFLANPPDNGHGLPDDVHKLYASYVGQFV